MLAPALAAPEAPLPPSRPKAATAAPLPPARSPGRSMPLPPARPAEIEEAREAEAQDAEAQDAGAQEAAQQAQPQRQDAPVRLAARSVAPEPAGRRPSGKAMPLPPARPAEIEEAREAEAQDAQQQVQPAPQAPPFRFTSRTTEPEPSASPGSLAAPEAEAPAGEPGTLPPVCAALVEDGAIRAELDKSIPRKGSCGLAEPVRLTAVRLADGTMVPLKPAAVSNCAIAAAAASWVREELAPAVAALGAPVTAVRVAASYDCRPRNRIPGARMSEHGLGNALDVGGFELADGRVVLVEKGGLPPRLRATMKDSACRRFTTVLGPGSDGYHEDHIHVDLAQRRLDIRLCRWNLDAGTAVAASKGKPPAGKPAAPKPDGDPAHPVAAEGATDTPEPPPAPAGAKP